MGRKLPELLRAAERRINAHVWPNAPENRGADAHLASIPANPDTDVDLLLMEAANKIEEMFKLLLECRDALPAIPLASAKLRGLDLRLADRIEDCIEPWRLPADSPASGGTKP